MNQIAFMSFGTPEADIDNKFLNKFHDNLEQLVKSRLQQFELFMFEGDIPAGANWPNTLINKIKSAKLLIIMISPKYFVSAFCCSEYFYFKCKEEGQILAVYYDNLRLLNNDSDEKDIYKKEFDHFMCKTPKNSECQYYTDLYNFFRENLFRSKFTTVFTSGNDTKCPILNGSAYKGDGIMCANMLDDIKKIHRPDQVDFRKLIDYLLTDSTSRKKMRELADIIYTYML